MIRKHTYRLGVSPAPPLPGLGPGFPLQVLPIRPAAEWVRAFRCNPSRRWFYWIQWLSNA